MRATDASKKALYFTPRRPINPLISPKKCALPASAHARVAPFDLLRRGQGRSHGPSLAFGRKGGPYRANCRMLGSAARPQALETDRLMRRGFRSTVAGGLLV